MDSRKQQRATIRRLVTLAAAAALTTGGVTACASTAASAKPSAAPLSGSAGGSSGASAGTTPTGTPLVPVTPSGSPSIQPGGPMIPGPSTSPAAPAPGQTFKGTGFTSNGDILTVRFFAGVCEKYGLDANQATPGKVLVTIVVTQHPTAGERCPMVITQQQVSVNLGSPLDGRAVVDTSTGKALPQVDAPTSGKYYSPGPVKIGS